MRIFIICCCLFLFTFTNCTSEEPVDTTTKPSTDQLAPQSGQLISDPCNCAMSFYELEELSGLRDSCKLFFEGKSWKEIRKELQDCESFRYILTGEVYEGELGVKPILEFDHLEYDFGTLKQGDQLKHRFKFTNKGYMPLMIRKVKPDCSCTTPKEWPQQAINFDDVEYIEIAFDSEHREGNVYEEILVLTNAKPDSVWLTLKGNVILK